MGSFNIYVKNEKENKITVKYFISSNHQYFIFDGVDIIVKSNRLVIKYFFWYANRSLGKI